jgi:hypothetical protein
VSVPSTFTCAACGAERPMDKSRRRHLREGQRRFVCDRRCRGVLNHSLLRSATPARHGAGYLIDLLGPAERKLAHRAVVDRALGRELPRKHPVHHVDENKTNNAHCNLVVCENEAYHQLLHDRARTVRAGGRPSVERLCATCGILKPLADFGRRPRGGYRGPCRECERAAWRRRHAA